MRVPGQVTLDAQFGRDIEFLRYEFRPNAGGTRADVFIPVVVVAPGHGEVTLMIHASDLYLLAWQNAHGTFLLSDHPDSPGPDTLSFSSHYNDLGVFRQETPISLYGIYSAVRDLADAQNLARANELRVQVGLMALTVPEALRQDIVAGLMESLFANRRDGDSLQRELIKHYANNYSRQSHARDPYVEVPLNTSPELQRTRGYPPQR